MALSGSPLDPSLSMAPLASWLLLTPHGSSHWLLALAPAVFPRVPLEISGEAMKSKEEPGGARRNQEP